MVLNPFELHLPKTIDEAAVSISRLVNGRVLAGGTFLINNLKNAKKRGRKTPEHIISLKHIPELSLIVVDQGEIQIGSMATLTQIAEDPALTKAMPVLKKVCSGIGTTPIRNMATIGGNLVCRYTWTELPALMIALQARLHFKKGGGPEAVISAEEFFGCGAKSEGLLTKISLPIIRNLVASYQRATRVPGIDTPMLAVCVSAIEEGCILKEPRVVINSAVTFPRRDQAVEKVLDGRPVSERVVEEVAANMTEEIYSDSDEYKRHLFGVYLKNVLREFIGSNHKEGN